MLLANGNELMDKMVGVSGLWTDLQFLSELVLAQDLEASELLIAKSLLQPLTANELNIGAIFESEQRTLHRELNRGAQSIIYDYGIGGHGIRWLLQKNATLNLYYRQVATRSLAWSKLSALEFAAAMQSPDKVQQSAAKGSMINLWPSTLYNFGGKFVLPWFDLHPEDYIGRVHDLNGLIRLVKLQLALESKGTATIQGFLQTTNLTDPYTGTAMSFDADTRWLEFDCLDRSSHCRIKL